MAISPTSISFWIFWAMTGFFRCLGGGGDKLEGQRGREDTQTPPPPHGMSGTPSDTPRDIGDPSDAM